VLLAFPIWLILPLVPLVLTLLAWREGLRALATAESKDGLRSRTLLPMLFLAGPVAMLLGLVGLQAGHFASLTAPGRMMIIGSAAAVAALITSTRSPRGFRPLAILRQQHGCFATAFRYWRCLRSLGYGRATDDQLGQANGTGL